jgi:hypothetical protein
MFKDRINCGYARVAIRTLSNDNKASRQTQFQAMFKPVTGYLPDSSYFELQDKQRESSFDRGCTHVLKQFNKKWHPNDARCDYMATFSPECWKRLPLKKKRTHTLQSCQGCQLDHAELQAKFPGTELECSSVQHFTTSAEIASDSVVAATVTNACIRKSATRKALTIINQASEKTLGMPFSKAVLPRRKGN